MTDDSSDELEITKAELDKATRDFEIVYGATIAEWSRLEGRLFYWFQLLTGMNEKIARAVFFSARSFNGRADMLAAALNAASLEPPLQDFLKTALRKAWAYSGFRNAATHGEPHINLQRGSPSAKQIVIIQGRVMSHEAETTMITMLDLMTATNSFRHLCAYLFEAHPDQGPKPPSLLETYQLRVHELPNQPQSIEPNRNPLTRETPPRS